MTMSTAETGATNLHANETGKDNSSIMWAIAILLIGSAAAAFVALGLGGLIMWGVIASWVSLALLVLLTAGG